MQVKTGFYIIQNCVDHLQLLWGTYIVLYVADIFLILKFIVYSLHKNVVMNYLFSLFHNKLNSTK
jgi:hypothetical protein